MSNITLSANAGGTGIFTIASPSSNTNRTLTLPDVSGTFLTSGGAIAGTTGTFSGAVQASGISTNLYPLVVGTAVASTSGTSIDFTGIPSWVRRITVMFNGVSLSGSANPVIQLGISTGVETTGYSSITTSVTTTNNTTRGITSTAYFQLQFSGSAPFTQTGNLVLSSLGNNIWIASGLFYAVGGIACDSVAGGKTLGGTLDRVRITTTNGTDTFDAGSINILYE